MAGRECDADLHDRGSAAAGQQELGRCQGKTHGREQRTALFERPDHHHRSVHGPDIQLGREKQEKRSG